MNNEKSKNCTLIASKDGPMTLQQIGDIFGVTRMRICQLEKRILKKIETVIDSKVNQ
jgi:DNA-directed RNA polymerase sigma subunit (sigma70/sigma32)